MPSSTLSTYNGSWNAETRAVPALAFIEQYARTVDSLNLTAVFSDWYAPSSIFYNSDGVIYRGGDEIWTWMKSLFGPFSALHHEVERIRAFDEEVVFKDAKISATRIIVETKTAFTVKGLPGGTTPIVVPRLLQFLVGASEEEGQGTDGLQILEANVWWDSGSLQKQIQVRKDASQ